ncbi:hypothetical protein JQ628_26900 [Bradyrhizobium lablabi]|uniref:hypothetical protein n=1 Tax=Bradyrhizobium lablabi TaxID=722472 RepID=UPI001BA8EB9A|nr:hypothetical protein [Bradyrhizobium lablabi]MBR1125178.1 hypothetical protein [Bradyrhizobium lablabi]
MLQRLVYVAVVATAVLVGITVVLGYFSDMQPVAFPEPQSVWRFEAAFLLTAAQWIALAVVGIALFAIVVLLCRSARPRMP